MEEEYHRLSRQEFLELTRNSADPQPRGRVTRDGMNRDLTDRELSSRIRHRNSEGKDTYLLRLEYNRRLRQREL